MTALALFFTIVQRLIGRAHILTLNLLPRNIITSRCKQSRPASSVHGILHHRPRNCHSYFTQRAISVYSLLWLVRVDCTRMNGIDPGAHLFVALETWLIAFHALYESAHKQNLGKLRAVVEIRGSDICIDLIERGEGRGGGATAVEV